MKKQITLFIFMLLVMTVIFLKRMGATEAGQATLVRSNSKTQKSNPILNKEEKQPFDNEQAAGNRPDWK